MPLTDSEKCNLMITTVNSLSTDSPTSDILDRYFTLMGNVMMDVEYGDADDAETTTISNMIPR